MAAKTTTLRDERDNRLWREKIFPAMRALGKVGYFPFTVQGQENVPRGEPLLFVDNHSGWFPMDAFFVNLAIHDHVSPDLVPFTATLDSALAAPVLGSLLQKLGGLPASAFVRPERLPAWVNSCAMFPEGAMGNTKPFWHAYRMRPWHRGFVRYALARKAKIVPVAVLGAEESLPVAGRLEALRPLLRAAFPVPIVPLPLPARWEVVFLEPVDLATDTRFGKPSMTDSAYGQRVADGIRAMVQAVLDARTTTRPIATLSRWVEERGPARRRSSGALP
jgi:1-acyl-sn-glycerol-3-phosphate acyltransferase